MVGALDNVGLEPEHIARRVRFLLLRSEHHLAGEHESTAELAKKMGCVGTLLRDAACLALLLEEDVEAKKFLRKSGEAWASIGLFAGYTVLRLSGDTNWAMRYAKDLVEAAMLFRRNRPEVQPSSTQALDSRVESVETQHGFGSIDSGSEERPYLAASVASRRQLLNLLQAAPNLAGSDLNGLTSLIRHRWNQQPSGVVEGMRLQSYVRLLDSLSSGELGQRERESLTLMVLNRAERLAAARDDAHHWKRMLNPAFIVDLDLLTLCVYAAENGLTGELDEIMEDRPPLESLPWTVAKRLVAPDPGPKPEYR